ncbi:response regulator [Archangium lansingense]|uniref:Response regulator n=1 Tax=Archangium lansingense TaxID=2995310 RepID=A0ABT4AKX1_9BACT|nr:response regulator [Archangium lansinium]MCY1081951.1 response regulator [Archangium lansinium]
MLSSLPSEPHPPRILLAEDDAELRALLTLTLARAGCAVVALEDGFELSDYVSLTKVCGGPLQPPDLILSDVRMPGLTGLEVLTQVQAAGLFCPVVILSAFADDATREAARRLGASAFLDKPVDLDVLTATVRQEISTPHGPGLRMREVLP